MGYYDFDFDNRFSCEVSVRKISKQKDGKDAVLKKYYKCPGFERVYDSTLFQFYTDSIPVFAGKESDSA